MARYYQKRKETGDEYVKKVKDFCSVTTYRCMQLPKSWYGVLLKGMIETVRRIEENVVMANAVYIDGKAEKNVQIKAFNERDAYLYQALRLFKVYDTQFEHLMGYIDITAAEKRRLSNIFRSIIAEEQKKNPDIKDIEIRVVSRNDEFEYVSLNQSKCLKLKLTAKNKDAWLKKEADAIDYINKRIRKDKGIVGQLSA